VVLSPPQLIPPILPTGPTSIKSSLGAPTLKPSHTMLLSVAKLCVDDLDEAKRFGARQYLRFSGKSLSKHWGRRIPFHGAHRNGARGECSCRPRRKRGEN